MKTILLALGLLLFAWPAAWACSCVGERTSEKAQIARAYRNDDLILIGRVVSVEIITSPDTLPDTLHAKSHRTGQDTVYARGTQQPPLHPGRGARAERYGHRHHGIGDNSWFGRRLRGKVETGVDYLLNASVIDQEATMRGVVQSVLPYYGTSICHRTRELKYIRRGELRHLRRLAQSA